MKFSRNATANWKGSGRENGGTLSTQSGILNATPYSFKMRFGDQPGTNPEELIGAAHAGCFTMQLAVFLTDAGHDPANLETKSKVTFEDGNITEINLDLVANVPGMDEPTFIELANKAKANCPVSKLLKANITLSVKFLTN